MSPRVISFHYTLTSSRGEVLDSSRGQEPLTFLEGGGQIIPGLESRMQELKGGEQRKIEVPAAEAYGERDEAMQLQIPKENLNGQEVQVGDQLQSSQYPDGPALTVIDISDSTVTLDANHPLAGEDLTFDVEITEIREATGEELAHGHVHGPGGHHE